MRSKEPRVGVMASGNGSNLQALIDATHSEALEADIDVVISNREEAYCLQRARNAGIQALAVSLVHPAGAEERIDFEERLLQVLRPRRLDLIVLAGWMLVLSENFLRSCSCPCLNLHPALLEPEDDSFPVLRGAHAVREALRLRLPYTGVSVHRVTPEVDAGPVVMSEIVPIQTGDTETSLYDRVKAVEHRLLPLAVQSFLSQSPVGGVHA